MTKSYDKLDKTFAFICFILGYMFMRLCIIWSGGMGTMLTAAALLLVEAAYFLIAAKKKIDASLGLGFSLILILSLGFFFHSSPFIGFVNSVLFALLFVYVYYRACSNSIDKSFSKYLLFDIIKSAFVIPFNNVDAIWLSAFKKNEGTEKKQGGSVIIGLLIAAIPVIIITVLLSSDAAFSVLLSKIIRLDLEEIFISIACLIFGIPAAMYFFGVLYGNLKNPKSEILSAEKAEETKKKAQIASVKTVFAATVPLILVYIIFFASQLIYFISAFKKMLPDDFSYAQYARRGFFELCAVCVINFVIICFITAFTKRNDSNMPILLRISSALISLFTIMLVIIDTAKMLLYIGEYGLTQKRILTSVFMLLLGLIFLFLLLKQIFKNFKISLPCAVVTIVLSLALIFGNVDGIIASYNVSAYKSGKLDSVDISAMHNLDDSCVHFVLPLLDDAIYYYEADDFLTDRASKIQRRDYSEYTIYTFSAETALRKIGYLK